MSGRVPADFCAAAAGAAASVAGDGASPRHCWSSARTRVGARPPRRRSVEGCGHGRRATRPRASAPRSSAAPVVRKVRSSTPRPTPPRCGQISAQSAWRNSAPASTPSATPSCTCSATAIRAWRTPRPTPAPDNFANAPLDEAVEQAGGDHPSRAAAGARDLRRRAARSTRIPITSGCTRSRWSRSTPPAIPSRFPDAGPPWQPSKLYYSGFSFRRIRALHDAYERIGEESPYAERIAQMEERLGGADLPITPPTTLVDVGDFLDAAAPGAARAPHADRSRQPLDAGPRRAAARDVPVGGVRARPLAGAGPGDADAPTRPSTTCSRGSVPAADARPT